MARDVFRDAGPIDFVDVGCGGSVDAKWADLFPLLAYTGFDPNAAECERLARAPHPFRSARYLPHAIAGEAGRRTLHLTESPPCNSLLRPNHPWLARFSFARLFRETGEAVVECATLDGLAASAGLAADILKLDTQGLELPILRAGETVLSNCLCVETETGFVDNYVGETTFSDVDGFLRSRGFLMYDIAVHRVGRGNPLAESGTRQPLWCQATWLFDFVGREAVPSRARALKAFRICRALGCFDFGAELAVYGRRRGAIDAAEEAFLLDPANWRGAAAAGRKPPRSRTGKLLRLLPDAVNRRLLYGLKEILE